MWLLFRSCEEVRGAQCCHGRAMHDVPSKAHRWPVFVQGKYVVLFFYPLDFTFVCPTEITAFSDRHGDFKSKNAEVRAPPNLNADSCLLRHICRCNVSGAL